MRGNNLQTAEKITLNKRKCQQDFHIQNFENRTDWELNKENNSKNRRSTKRATHI